MRRIATLVAKEYATDPVGFARTILVFSALVGICLFFFSLPAMFTGITVGPHETAEYDLLAQGGITEEGIDAARATGADVLPVYGWGGAVSAGGDDTTEFESRIVPNMSRAAEMTELNRRYLIAGSYEAGHAVISKDIADDLGLDVGDTLVYRPALTNTSVEYEVSGIVRPGSHGRRTVVMDDRGTLVSRISENTRGASRAINASTVYGTAYVSCTGTQCRDAREVFDHNRTTVDTKAEQIEKQEASIRQFTESPVVRLAPIAGFALYGLIYLRRSLLRAGTHEPTYGVLRSLGASRRVPIAHILLDNAVVLTLTTALGVVLAGGLYRHAMDIFVPMGPLLELSATAFAANAAVIGAVSAVVVRRHAGKDVVELLEGGT